MTHYFCFLPSALCLSLCSLCLFLCALCVKAFLLLFLLRLSTVNCQLSAFSTGEYQSTLVSHRRRNKRRHAPRNLLNNRFCCPFGNIRHSAPICSAAASARHLPLASRQFFTFARPFAPSVIILAMPLRFPGIPMANSKPTPGNANLPIGVA